MPTHNIYVSMTPSPLTTNMYPLFSVMLPLVECSNILSVSAMSVAGVNSGKSQAFVSPKHTIIPLKQCGF